MLGAEAFCSVCVCVCGQLLELTVKVTGKTLMSLCAAVLDDLPLCPLSYHHRQPKHIGDMKSFSETRELLKRIQMLGRGEVRGGDRKERRGDEKRWKRRWEGR